MSLIVTVTGERVTHSDSYPVVAEWLNSAHPSPQRRGDPVAFGGGPAAQRGRRWRCSRVRTILADTRYTALATSAETFSDRAATSDGSW